MSIVEEEIDTLRSSIFYCDQRLCSADILPSSEVRTRIEVSVLTFLSFLSAASPVVPYLSLDTESGVVDCSALGPTGYAITGDLSILQNLDFISDARYIIILEKDAIFQRLVEDQIFNQIPCILITAKGYPDIATRFLLHRLSRAFPKLPIMALVDWNPAGLEILCTYKFGSSTMGLEAYRYACDVKWLGLRSGDLRSEMEEREMTARELKMAERLMASGMLQVGQEAELVAMVARGKRVEVEALYYWGFSFLGKFLVEKIVQGDYI